MKESSEEKNRMSGVVRTINILEVIAKKGSINLENLSKETDLPKATLLRFLSTLSSPRSPASAMSAVTMQTIIH